MKAEATAIDLAARELIMPGRPNTRFDLLSIDVGGAPDVPGAGSVTGEAGVPVKPIGRFLARLAALERELVPGARIAVGGGAAGCELAIALALRLAGR